MSDNEIHNIAEDFRDAVQEARDTGKLAGFTGLAFERYPVGCCGATCDILAEHLLNHYNLETIYVWGWMDDQSHAWLVVKDERVSMPRKRNIEYSDKIESLLNTYGANRLDHEYEARHYEPEDLEHGLIIDITGDWVGGKRVYVDYICDFYRSIRFRDAHDELPGDLSYEKSQILRVIEEYL